MTHVLITHCHCDHALGADALRRWGARVVASGRTGDLLFHSGHPGWAGAGENDSAATLASLAKLRGLDLARVYPGHGVAIGDVDDWLRRGLAAGRAGHWDPTTQWQAEEVPDCLRQPGQ